MEHDGEEGEYEEDGDSAQFVNTLTGLGGSGFRFVVNLQERTCSCRQWQVSGVPCKHALAFITSLSNAHIRDYVDLYYSTNKFRAAYAQLIPAMPDKTQWPKSDHGFFMHPPLLKATAGRPKTERYKGCGEKKRKSGQHLCPICKGYGHHWHNCKKGNPDDIAAMLEVRGPPKKKVKSTIVPYVDEAPTRMCFPPTQILETTTTKEKATPKSSAGTFKRLKTSSSQPMPSEKNLPVKAKAKKKKKDATVIPTAPLDSPAMSTRSKTFIPASPAMSTRSKRRLSL